MPYGLKASGMWYGALCLMSYALCLTPGPLASLLQVKATCLLVAPALGASPTPKGDAIIGSSVASGAADRVYIYANIYIHMKTHQFWAPPPTPMGAANAGSSVASGAADRMDGPQVCGTMPYASCLVPYACHL
jgi:hypothetical protein